MQSQVARLLNTAQTDSLLTPASASIFTGNTALQNQIQAALGASANLFSAAEGILLNLLVDDSGSIEAAGNEGIIVEGCNTVLDAVEGAQSQDNVLVHTLLLNGKIINPFIPLSKAVRLDQRNYRANGGTPLYDMSTTLLGTVVAKTTELREAGIPVQTITLIVSDGRDEHSHRNSARDVASIVKDLRQFENNIVAGMGISDGRTNFEKVFGEMGIDPKWILTPANSPKEIRAAFRMVSQRASSAVASGVAFSQVAQGGGFATP